MSDENTDVSPAPEPVNTAEAHRINSTTISLACGVEMGVSVMQELIGTQISNIAYEDKAELMGAAIQKEVGA